MTLREFGQAVEYNIEHGLKYAVLGLGPAGVGKSQIIRQIGKKYGYKVIDIRLAQMSEVEIGGLIYPNAERTKTVWLSPEILPDEKRDGEHTILLLDEITSCTKRVQVAAYQLILDRRIGQYTLPEGTYVVALGNREDDDGVFIRLAAPLADRFEIHEIDVDFQSWKEDYALKHGVHPYVVDYLTSKPSALHTQKQDGDSMVFATPRSWDRVSDILHFDSNTQKRVIQHKIIGNIGTREGAQFIVSLSVGNSEGLTVVGLQIAASLVGRIEVEVTDVKSVAHGIVRGEGGESHTVTILVGIDFSLGLSVIGSEVIDHNLVTQVPLHLAAIIDVNVSSFIHVQALELAQLDIEGSIVFVFLARAGGNSHDGRHAQQAKDSSNSSHFFNNNFVFY